MSITLARTCAVYDLTEVQEALDRSRGRSPELEAFYERMLETGADRFVTKPSSLDALDPLFEECPNFDEVLDDLARYLALAHAGNRGFNVMPILLLGGPGVGKTHFAKRLVRGEYANPVFVLDEVEKASGSTQSDPLAALYQLLEPETACAFRDEFIDVDIDASQIFWVLTANSVEGIPHPLLNRMAVYEVPAPTLAQAAAIAQRMYTGLLAELNLAAFDPRLGDVVLDRLAEVSPRDLRKTLLDALGYAVAAGSEHVAAADVRIKATPGKGRIGF
ncbi:MAG: hypothetical protein EOO64_02525 [Massilia sp.]|nr:MAG: hypothetical protein EOO64_02525 [Massilia sp.]